MFFAPRGLQAQGASKGRRLEIPEGLIETSLKYTHTHWLMVPWIPGPQFTSARTREALVLYPLGLGELLLQKDPS